MKKYRFEILIFVVEFVYMVLELVASRVLSPYFGNSNLVWTSVIGIILISSSIGNFVGGKIADKGNKERNLKFVLLGVCAFILLTAIIQKNVLKGLAGSIDSINLGSIITTIVLFFIPSMLIGFISPIVLKLKLENIEVAGRTAGRLNAIATIGGITGTFIGGFLLIPNIVSTYILYILVIVLVCLIPFVDLKIKAWTNIAVSGLLIASICLLTVNVNLNKSNADKVLKGYVNCTVTYDTEYSHIQIYNKNLGTDQIRYLDVNGGHESATYTDKNRRYELVYVYTTYYDLIVRANIDINDTLLIGGGGYSYPKHYISLYPDKRMDVVEIDSKITELAKKYFYLDQLIKEFDLTKTKRLNLITQDGRVYLNKNKKMYDAILNDAFSGFTPVPTLTTIEAVTLIKNSLNRGGFYLTNVISSLEGINSRFLKAQVNTLQQVFNNVYVFPCVSLYDLDVTQNIMVLATDDSFIFAGKYDIEISPDELILTDEYCPVEQLVPKR